MNDEASFQEFSERFSSRQGLVRRGRVSFFNGQPVRPD